MKRLLALVALFFASPALSATYYVDCTASNDQGAGTSTSTPWKTINKVNNSRFQPGDSILLKRGCTWREQLTVPSSGAAGTPITFGAFGSGSLPVVTGADNITAGPWIQSAANIYYTVALLADPTVVWLDGASYPEATSVTAVNSTNRWFWAGAEGRLYIYADSHPDGFYSEIEAPTRTNALSSYAKDYVTFDRIVFKYGRNNTVQFGGGAEHNTVQNCTIAGAGYYTALLAIEASDYLTVTDCTILGENLAGIDTVRIGNSDVPVTGTTIRRCTIKNGIHTNVKLLYSVNGLYEHNIIKNDSAAWGRTLEVLGFAGVGGNVIRYNWIEGAYNTNGHADDGNNLAGQGNELYGNVITTGNSDGLVMGDGAWEDGKIVNINNKAYNNVIYGFGRYGIYLGAQTYSPADPFA